MIKYIKIIEAVSEVEKGIFNILCVGDVVGENGTDFIKSKLWSIRDRYKVDFAVVNGENSAAGNGIDKFSADTLFSSGADVITTGNHVFRKREIYDYMEKNEYLLRPANYPAGTAGNGYCIYKALGYRVLVMNLLGTVYMESMDCPFRTAQKILEREKGEYDISIADFHAEATSEKKAFAYFFDGEISLVFGTHTHVQTSDEQIFENGTGYITDAGMTGPYESVLGVKKEIVINKFLTKMPCRFEEADGSTIFNAVLFSYDINTKKTVDVKRISEIH